MSNSKAHNNRVSHASHQKPAAAYKSAATPNVSGSSGQIPPVPRASINTRSPECTVAPGADLSSFEELLESHLV